MLGLLQNVVLTEEGCSGPACSRGQKGSGVEQSVGPLLFEPPLALRLGGSLAHLLCRLSCFRFGQSGCFSTFLVTLLPSPGGPSHPRTRAT